MIKKHYDTISKLIAQYGTERIGVCTDNKAYYIHKRNEIYGYVNPMGKYREARIREGVLLILI